MREMRRSDRKLDQYEILPILQKGEYGILSYLTEEGDIMGIPLNYVIDSGAIYFHSALEGEKIDGLKKNPKVSFTVVGSTEVLPSQFGTLYESVIVKGEVSFPEGDEKREALSLLIDKYSPTFVREGQKYIEKAQHKTAVVKMLIQSMSGKARKS